jgi:hypothetical protein
MKILFFICLIIIAISFTSCDDSTTERKKSSVEETEVAYLPEKDIKIQRNNLELQKKAATNRFPCDTLALKEFILNNYPEGTYLVDFDKTVTYDIPDPAVIYLGEGYTLAVIAKSGTDERLIEMKNVVGYEQSFIDLDSTELGTPFFYLILFECSKNLFSIVWETPIPSHGGFNHFLLENWSKTSSPQSSDSNEKYNNTQYVKVNFHYAQGIGHIDYNYFFIDGLTQIPHLLMTYEGINFKRTITNYNNDEFPDYYEFVYYDTGDRVYVRDSVAFIWNVKEKVYINTRNSKQTRQY